MISIEFSCFKLEEKPAIVVCTCLYLGKERYYSRWYCLGIGFSLLPPFVKLIIRRKRPGPG